MSEHDKQGESDAEYLTRHGWTHTSDATDKVEWWVDPMMHVSDAGGVSQVRQDAAVTIQGARDQAEERAAWDLYAAHGPPDPASLGNLSDLGIEERAAAMGQWADLVLIWRRSRFARKVQR